MNLQEEVLKLNQSDFLRHYIFVKEKYDAIRKENPGKTSVLMHYVKNPDKVKNRIYEKRRQEQEKVRAGT